MECGIVWNVWNVQGIVWNVVEFDGMQGLDLDEGVGMGCDIVTWRGSEFAKQLADLGSLSSLPSCYSSTWFEH